MKHKSIWLALALTVAVIAGVLLDPTQVVVGKLAGDAFFEGRPTRYWVRSLQAGPARQADALSTLEQGKSAAVPVLVAILNGTSVADAETRCAAPEVLAKIGPDAAEAGPAVLAGLSDPDSHLQAVCAEALPKLEVPARTAVPLLIPLLKTTNAVVAAKELSRYRAAAAPAVPDLVTLLTDKRQTSEARWNAARTLAKIGPEAMGGLDALVDSLGDDDWMIREHSAEAIGELGEGAAEKGVPALTAMLSDPVARVRRDAVRSLGYFGAASRAAAPEIKKLLDDQEEVVRKAATKALTFVDPGESRTSAPSVEEPDD
ncbi:MAG TPA: HEAT repeat domain-containing protein [Pirellulales bacterium]|nr:HEAT repeat domain-containing protein [Pirellulales bacterium]